MTSAGVVCAGPEIGWRAAFATASALLLATLVARWKTSARAGRETPQAPLAYLFDAASVGLLLTLAALAPEGAALVALATIAASIGLAALDPAARSEGVKYRDGHGCM